MDIPAELQERTDNLLQELQSELGKHGANQFVLMRTAIHFEENTSVNPRELMNTGSPSTEDFWDQYMLSPPADDSDPSSKYATSNKDLDEILGLLPARGDNTSSISSPVDSCRLSSEANQDTSSISTPVDSCSLSSEANQDTNSISGTPKTDQDMPLCKRCNSRSLSFEADQDIPLCKRCNCEECKKRQDRAKKKGKKQATMDVMAKQFPRKDLIDFFDKYWEVLKFHGLFSNQSGKPFEWLAEVNCPAYVQRRQYHLILRYLQKEGDLQQWRRSIAEYQTVKGYDEFRYEVTKQRLSGIQVRAPGQNDSNTAHKVYVRYMFPEIRPEELPTTQAALKQDLQFGRRWKIFADGCVAEGDDLEVPALSTGIFLLAGSEIMKMMCARSCSGSSLVNLC